LRRERIRYFPSSLKIASDGNFQKYHN